MNTDKLITFIAEIASLMADMEGMKAVNKQREYEGTPMAYNDADFNYISIEINKAKEKALTE
jgi:hypothetical protein